MANRGVAMNYAEFVDSIASDSPAANLSSLLQALWWAKKGDWDRAHKLAQAQNDPDGAWVHAYLHRVEGDLPNAAYWYRRAGKPEASSGLDEEWDAIAAALLKAAA